MAEYQKKAIRDQEKLIEVAKEQERQERKQRLAKLKQNLQTDQQEAQQHSKPFYLVTNPPINNDRKRSTIRQSLKMPISEYLKK